MSVKMVHATAAGVAARYAKQNGTARSTYGALLELGDGADVERVAEVIGNNHWTHFACYGCGEYVSTALEITGGDGESSYACLRCLNEAGLVEVSEMDMPDEEDLRGGGEIR